MTAEYNNQSKKVALPGRIPAKIAALIKGGCKQTLIPAAGLVEGKEPGQWIATGKDPQFRLQGSWPTGWIEVCWTGASDPPRRLKLYLDRGRGFNDVESISLGAISGRKKTPYRVYIPIGVNLQQIRLDPGEEPGVFTLEDFKFVGLGRTGILLRAVALYFRENGFNLRTIKQFCRETAQALVREGVRGLWKWAKRVIPAWNNPFADYDIWLAHHKLTEGSRNKIRQEISRLSYKPTFSVLVPVYNVEERWLRRCIESVLNQLYPYWELCIADDASTDPNVRRVLEEYGDKDQRIKVIFREKNGHISAASNSALELAGGEFVALLDNDDELSEDALYETARMLNKHPEADMIYSDEDKIDEKGERNFPFFKPDWSPDTILSQMYTCHLGVYRTELVRQIGGFRLGLEGSQDHDLVLRLAEKTGRIYHIPKILYHWRTVSGSTASAPDAKNYATTAGEKAVQDALARRGENGWVESPGIPGVYRVHYTPSSNPLISIIIPTRDMAKILSACLESIFAKTTYQNFEVIIVDNESVQKETLALFERWREREPERFRVIRLEIPFNYSELNNQAVKIAKGELILLLNNDVEVITPNWLEEMAGQALRPQTGAVGSILLYPDGTIQHAGVVLGIGGIASHGHKYFEEDAFGYFSRLCLVSNYSAVTGACLMVRKEVYEAVGGLETQLQVAYNDVDFCLKILSKGYNNLVLPQVRLYHHESKSRGLDTTPEKIERFLTETAYMKKKWGALLENDPCYNPNLSLDKDDFSLAIPLRVQID